MLPAIVLLIGMRLVFSGCPYVGKDDTLLVRLDLQLDPTT